MKLGTDFFSIFSFVIEIVKLVIRFFGDEEDKKSLDDNGKPESENQPWK
jgi:hypothetical protein